jgi:hypothetical protein
METVEVKKEAELPEVECDAPCCGGPYNAWKSPEWRAEREAWRKTCRDNAVRLLEAAEEEAADGEVERANAFANIAAQWDSIGY